MKIYPVIISFQAKDSLTQIISYISQGSPIAANYVRRHLIDLIRSLGNYLQKFSIEPFLADRKLNIVQ